MTTLSDVATFPDTMLEFHRQMAVRFRDSCQQFEAAYPVKSEGDIPAALLAVGRDQTFTVEMRTWARMVAAAGQKAFLYQFTHVPPSPNAKTWGAYHASEIPYVFGTLRNRSWPFTETDFKLSQEMASYWTNFAIAGDPNGKGLPAWAPYDLADEPVPRSRRPDPGETSSAENAARFPRRRGVAAAAGVAAMSGASGFGVRSSGFGVLVLGSPSALKWAARCPAASTGVVEVRACPCDRTRSALEAIKN